MLQNHLYLLSDSKSDDNSRSTVGKNKGIAINTPKFELILIRASVTASNCLTTSDEYRYPTNFLQLCALCEKIY